jgi:hypothetical protein
LEERNLPDNSKEEKEFEVHMKEYELLRAEISNRLDAQNQLTNMALVLLGGVTAASQFLFTSNAGILHLTVSPIHIILTLLIIALLFTSLIWAFLLHQLELGRIGVYINRVLRRKISHFLGQGRADQILLWDRFHTEQLSPRKKFDQIATTLLAFSQLGIMGIPAIGALIAAGWLYGANLFILPTDIWKFLAALLLLFDLTYLLAIWPCSLYVLRVFQSIQ